MSALRRTIEGTWDEILKHAPELAGHLVRLTVLDSQPAQTPPEPPQEDADEWIRSLYEWAHNRRPLPTIVDDNRESIYADRLDRQL